MKEGWEYKKIGLLCDIKTGKLDANAASPNGKYPFFTCSREILKIDNYAYDCECILVAGNGELNAKYYKGKFNAYQRTYIITLKPNTNEISTKYLYCFFSKYIETLRQRSIGGVIKYIKLGDLTNAQIPVPDYSRQLIIIEELDLLSSIIEKKKTQLNELDNLAQSLFYEMFGDPITNEKGWEVKKLKEACICITDGDHMPPPKANKGIPFITISNIDKQFREIDFRETFFVPQSYYDSIKEERKTQIGDVLYTVTGSYGIPIIVNEFRRFCFQRHIALLRPNILLVSSYFLCYWALCKSIKYMADEVATGIAQKTVGLSSLRNFPIIIPPLALQQQFASKIEAIEHQKELIKQSIKEVETLFNSRMDYYFN